MAYNLYEASEMLNSLDLNFNLDNLGIEFLIIKAYMANGEYRIKKHVHSSYEFHFFAEGFHTIELDKNEYMIGPGYFCITPPGIYHGGLCHAGSTNTEYSILCNFIVRDGYNSEAIDMLGILRDSPAIMHKDTLGITELFNQALHEAYYKGFGYFSTIKSLLARIIMLSARTVQESSSAPTPASLAKHKKNNYLFCLAKKFMDDNIGNALTASDIAQNLFLSTKQLSRIIKNNTGMSTMEYLAAIRLNKARELLKLTSSSIGSIADTLGFSSEFYFSQFFKRMEGVSPTAYRSLSDKE